MAQPTSSTDAVPPAQDSKGDPSPNASAVASRPGLSLGTPFGIAVRADWSLLFIFALIAFNLGGGLFPRWHPGWSPELRWSVAISAAILFVASILLHELSHALVGRAMGVKIGGITLFMFGGMAHVEREPDRPAAELWMAIVGPITSLVIGFAAIAAGRLLGGSALEGVRPDDLVEPMRRLSPLATLLLWLGPVNVILALFNLLPGFPLDGGRVLRALLWWTTGNLTRATRWASLVGQGFAWVMIATGLSMVFGLVVPILGGGLFQGVWLMLIGWFLSNAASAAYRQVVVEQAVKDVPVRELMDTHVQTVSPDLPVSVLVRERLLHSEQRCFPVSNNDTLEGLVCLDDVRRVAPVEWEHTPISHIMTPVSRLAAVTPDDQATRALELLAQKDVDQIPVVDHGVLRGLVRRRDLVRWVSLHQPLR